MAHHYGIMEASPDKQSTVQSGNRSSKLLTLFNFYWQKFLYKTKVIEREEEMLEQKLKVLESEVKLKKMRGKIDTFS
jgi:hypothetical protein